MSVIRMLTRWCAVAALRGKTWADDRVFDSDNTPLAQALTLNAAAKPYIVVYTDADNRVDIQGTDIYNSRRELNLVLEIGVASKVQGETNDATLKIPLTDEGMELTLDMVEEQALSALFGDPQSDWAELLKTIVLRVDRVPGQRGASADRDRRWAARQLSIICDVVSDLPLGVPVPSGHPVRMFPVIAAANPEAGMEHVIEICDALNNRAEMPQWEQMQATLGLRRLGLRGIGLAPLSSELPNMAVTLGDDLTDTRGEAPLLRELVSDDVQMTDDPAVGKIDLGRIKTNVADIKLKEPKDKIVTDSDGPTT